MVGDAEDEVEDAGLDVVEGEDAGEQEGAELGDGGADGVAGFAEDVPEDDGGGGEGEAGELEALEAGVEFVGWGCGLGDAGEVAFDVGGKDGDADGGEGFGEDLEGDGFAGAGGSGDQAVAVAHAGEKGDGLGGGAGLGEGDGERLGHAWVSPWLDARLGSPSTVPRWSDSFRDATFGVPDLQCRREPGWVPSGHNGATAFSL